LASGGLGLTDKSGSLESGDDGRLEQSWWWGTKKAAMTVETEGVQDSIHFKYLLSKLTVK
jgi:hypothetical protein